MEPFTTLTATAVPLGIDNVDTDAIIPKQFLKTIKRTGLSRGLFYEMRVDDTGNPVDFVLDRPEYQGAQILIAGDNFGCGSSREHAPWALLDHGIRCIIAESFADIFYGNCLKNGILPVPLGGETTRQLRALAERGDGGRFHVDLDAQTITGPDGCVHGFDIEPFRKHCLLNGLDDIALTLERGTSIAAYEAEDARTRPWLYPNVQPG